ncbi:MAG: PEP-CTERM sorting domain-containing protein [Desulfococcaceae bacterium]
MKKMLMVCSFVLVVIGAFAFNAEALPMIDGAISFSGTPVQDNLDLTLATAFTGFSNAVVSSTGGNGSYDPALQGQAVTFTPFAFRPNTDPIVPLWTFDFDMKTYSFDVTDFEISYSSYNTLVLKGEGIAHITGFEDTAGDWYFTSNGTERTSSFSISTDVSPVPEPATIVLLGLGLLGTGKFARRKAKK